MPTSFVSTPCCASACSRTWPAASTAAWSTSWLLMRCSRLAGGSFQGEPFTAGPSSISSCSVSTASSGSGSCTFGLRGPGLGRRRWAASGSSRSMSWSASWSKSRTPCAGGRRAAEREEVPADALGGVDEREPGRTGGGRRALGRDAHRHPGEHHEAGQHEGAEDETGAPRRDAGRERSGGGHAEQAAGVDQLVDRRVQARPAVGEVEQPAATDRDHQPTDPEVGLRGGIRVGVVVGDAAHQHDAERRRARRGTMTRPQPTTMPMPSSRPRPTGPAALAYTPMPATIPTAMQRRPTTSPAWLPSAEASAAVSRSSRDGGGAAFFRAGARLVPPPRGRWVVATVATTVPVTTTATRETPHPTSVQPQHAWRRSAQTSGGQRFRWQVGQYVVPRASMTVRLSSVPQRRQGWPARP